MLVDKFVCLFKFFIDWLFLKLLKVSKVSEHNSIKDIVLSDEWLEFCENLKKDIAPEQCFKTCGTKEVRAEPLRVETVYTADDGEVKNVETI